ncbi:MAG: HAD family hydrolase [Saprospiraceae bacterium]|nr:HAD family hydrolase [Saprospiraceae bacterium]
MNIDKSWTLFLDRDGVINHRLMEDYVKTWSEFQFLPGALDAIVYFSTLFGKIFVVTNQQGIAKGLMSEVDLQNIHQEMLNKINNAGGRIDKIYYCPHSRYDYCNCRKPRIGMALQAQKDFPDIDFNKSIMAGDTPSDIEFGKNAGMKKVFISQEQHVPPYSDWHVKSLIDFANNISKM